LAQEMSSVAHYLPCFKKWLFALSLHCLSCVCLLTEISFFPLTPPPTLLQFQHSIHPLHCLCVITVHCLLFSFVEGDQSVQGLCWFMFLGVDRVFSHIVWFSPVCSVS
jgi:hypothetical protein